MMKNDSEEEPVPGMMRTRRKATGRYSYCQKQSTVDLCFELAHHQANRVNGIQPFQSRCPA